MRPVGQKVEMELSSKPNQFSLARPQKEVSTVDAPARFGQRCAVALAGVPIFHTRTVYIL